MVPSDFCTPFCRVVKPDKAMDLDSGSTGPYPVAPWLLPITQE